MSQALTIAGETLAETARHCATSIRRTFPDHRAVYICSILFCGMTAAASVIWNVPLPFGASVFFIKMLAQLVVLLATLAAGVELVRMIRRGEPGSATRALAARLHYMAFAEDRPGNIFHSIVTFAPLMIAFSALKDAIPAIHPFAWDHTFMQWDRILGFGHMPWQLLQPILGYPAITAGINFVYDFWFFIMFGTLMWQAFAARGSVLRTQFLLAFAFAWFIGGNVLATILSSAGPCFYGHFFAHDPYAAQMQYLHTVAAHWPVWSIGVQDVLWQSYATGNGAVSGISAMPSMHVTVATVIALTGWRADRRLGIGLWIFNAIIVIGSVHLAWHYAVDGIAGLLLAVLFWKVAGLIARHEARQRPALETEAPYAAA